MARSTSIQHVGAFEAKTHFSALLDEVQQGKTVVVTRYGTAVAKLCPVDELHTASTASVIAAMRASRRQQSLGPELSVRALMEEGRR